MLALDVYDDGLVRHLVPNSIGFVAEVLGLHLPQAAFRVAHTGEDAVRPGIAHKPSAAIFDLEMEGLGGEGAAIALRATSQGSLLFIALSGSVSRLAELRKKDTRITF